MDLRRTQKGFYSIFMVVDRLTKVARFIAVMKTEIASRVAELFVEEIFVTYGLPQEIVVTEIEHWNTMMDIISEFWKSLFKLYGTKSI